MVCGKQQKMPHVLDPCAQPLDYHMGEQMNLWLMASTYLIPGLCGYLGENQQMKDISASSSLCLTLLSNE